MRQIILALLIILAMVSASYAIDEKAIAERIALLEAQKVQIEQAYIGIIARIEELKELLKPKEKETKGEQGTSPLTR